MVETEDYGMLVLSFYHVFFMIIDYFCFWYPVGFWYTNQGLGAPDQAVPLILSKGLARLPVLAKGLCQMIVGFFPQWLEFDLWAYVWAGIPESILGSSHSPP